jgi:hypothetical protein
MAFAGLARIDLYSEWRQAFRGADAELLVEVFESRVRAAAARRLLYGIRAGQFPVPIQLKSMIFD